MIRLMERWGKYWVIYYGFFLAVLALLLARYWYALDWQDESAIPFLAAIFGVAAGTALTITIIAEVLGRMVLLIPAAVRKLKAEGAAEGAAEANRKWRAWLERKAAAERDGLPFAEPPPG